MKAISIRQPWASMIIEGHKPVENRAWKAKYRGPILIHAGKKYDYDGENWIMNNSQYNPGMAEAIEKARDLRGGVIGSVTMVDCVTEHDSAWFFGPYGFVFTNPKPLDFEPMLGKLSFFEVPHYISVDLAEMQPQGAKELPECGWVMGCDMRNRGKCDETCGIRLCSQKPRAQRRNDGKKNTVQNI